MPETVTVRTIGVIAQSNTRFAVRSEINGRDNNEDSLLLCQFRAWLGSDDLSLLVVADGMGGHEHGEMVSREGVRKFALAVVESLMIEPAINRTAPPNAFNAETLEQHLYQALEQTNAHICRMVEQNGWHKAGSTLVAALIADEQALIINLGDSPLFHFRNGQLRQVTEDHTLAGALVRAGVLSEEVAHHHEGRNQLEFYLGMKALPNRPLTNRLSLERGDLLLLCSDGVNGSLEEAEMAGILANAPGDLEKAANQLLQAGRDKEETDNQTLILWQC